MNRREAILSLMALVPSVELATMNGSTVEALDGGPLLNPEDPMGADRLGLGLAWYLKDGVRRLQAGEVENPKLCFNQLHLYLVPDDDMKLLFDSMESDELLVKIRRVSVEQMREFLG